MFPSRTATAFASLLQIADAMLAPAAQEHDKQAHEARATAVASTAHPHRRPLTSSRRRRLAPQRPAQVCISPVGAAALSGLAQHAQSSAPRETTPR